MKPVFDDVLAASTAPHVQSSFEWLSLWFKHFGTDKELLVLLAQEDGKTIGIAPLMIHRRQAVYRGLLKLRTVSFIGYGFTGDCDFLVARQREDVIGSFFDYLFRNSHLWDEILLTHISETSPNLELIKKEIARKGHEVRVEIITRCPYVNIEGDFESYYATLGRNLRRDVMRNLKKLEADGTKVDFDVVDRIEERHMEELRELNRGRFEIARHRSFFLVENKYAFMKELLGVFAGNDRCRLFVARIGGNLAVYLLAFSFNGILYAWNTSYNLEYVRYSPGKLLLRHTLSYCFEKGYRVLDLMAGDEDYKLWWTEKIRLSYSIHARKRSLKTAIGRAYEKTRGKLKSNQARKGLGLLVAKCVAARRGSLPNR
ncbi:MAG: GNAT family N-acetyltransferase [Candidatus Eisenbacteria bacterium]